MVVRRSRARLVSHLSLCFAILALVAGAFLGLHSGAPPRATSVRPVADHLGSVASISIDSLGRGHAGPPGAGVSNTPLSNSNCSPTTDASTSGGSPAALEGSSTEVANGTVGSFGWSLWAAKSQTGANALEDGGIVIDGREYGLCPGYPNPAELEMIDTPGAAVVYGVIGYPGLAKIDLSRSTVDTFDVGKQLPAPQVKVIDGVSFFIGTLPGSACSYSALELDSTSPGVSAEHNLGFSGGCVENQIDPISFSQGIWQLPPGQFQTGF